MASKVYRLVLGAVRNLLRVLPPEAANAVRTSLFRAQAGWHRRHSPSVPSPSMGWPILLQVSIVKSGTHLLDQILTGFSRVSPFAPRALFLSTAVLRTGTPYSNRQLIEELRTFRPLEVVKTHLPAEPEIVRFVSSADFLTYFLYRDPRDVLVSRAHYGFIGAPWEVRKEFQNLSLDERIRRLIVGFDGWGFHHPGIATHYRRRLGWLGRDGVLALRYEELMGDRRQVVERIVDHFLQRIDRLGKTRATIVEELIANVDPLRSPTFRRGGVGEWKATFRDEHVRLFKERTGDLLVRLGYESDYDW